MTKQSLTSFQVTWKNGNMEGHYNVYAISYSDAEKQAKKMLKNDYPHLDISNTKFTIR